MKFCWLVAMCICCVQISVGLKLELTDGEKIKITKRIRDEIYGVSEQFVDDVLNILEKNGSLMTRATLETLLEQLTSVLKREKISKIDANSLKKFKFDVDYYGTLRNTTEQKVGMIDRFKTQQMTLSKYLPPERFNGIMNLLYATCYPDATTTEIESALDYLYGTGTADIKDLLAKFPDANASDCPEQSQRYSDINDRIKSMIDIKPQVLQDLDAIREKFPCNGLRVSQFLEDFVEILERLHRFGSRINACLVKENAEYFEYFNYFMTRNGVKYGRFTSRRFFENELKDTQDVLSTRLKDESFRGIIDFEKAVILETPTEEIQNALEYVLVDVPQANCSAEHKNE